MCSSFKERERCIYLGVLRLFPEKIQLRVELVGHIHCHLVVLFCQGLVCQHIFTHTYTRTQHISGYCCARMFVCLRMHTLTLHANAYAHTHKFTGRAPCSWPLGPACHIPASPCAPGKQKGGRRGEGGESMGLEGERMGLEAQTYR